MPPPQDPRVDELRQQLRSLGYLDAGVNRFVLGPARETRRPAAIALLASLRTGLIAAILLGPAAAIGLAGRLPGLLTGPRDAIVIAVYLGVLFGAGAALAALVASVLFARLAGAQVARRARRLSRAAGAIVALACLVYLTLWWHTANAGFGWGAPLWTIFALAVAVAISFILGHAVMVTTLAVMMASQPDGAAAPARSAGMSWRSTIVVAFLAFAGAAVLLASTSALGARRSADEPSPLAVVSSGLRVRLLAIDGFDPGVFAQLSEAGRLPALATAFDGARARLAIDNSRDPARAWTTVATGQPAEVHGVRGLETTRVAGLQGSVANSASALGRSIRAATNLLRFTRPAIASGHERREKTMWEVASDAGLRTAVVNWWATWPAPEDAGIVLSDRATLRLERGGPLDAEISPSSLYEKLRSEWPAIRERATVLVRDALQLASGTDANSAEVLQRSAQIDAIQVALAGQVATRDTDLVAVYLPGLDIAQHALLATTDAALGASAAAARIEALKAYYVFLDRLLAPLLVAGDGQLIVLVTEPGRVASASDGLLAAVGSAAKEGAAAGDARSIDVAPTVLQALGVPLSEQLAGRPLTSLFDRDFLTKYPVRRVATYGVPNTTATDRKGQPLDQEMIDRLRSLGYVR